MKLGLILSNLAQGTSEVLEFLEDNICSHQTKLNELSQKELTVVQNKYG